MSYIQPAAYPEAAWAGLCGQAKEATHLPVVYVGRVLRPATAEQVLADGHADLVGFARALIADPAFVSKARAGEVAAIRPCLGVNDCIDRRVVEGLEFACAANPTAGREHEGLLPPVSSPRSILVVGGGPAGMELAALSAERGHRVALWEREPRARRPAGHRRAGPGQRPVRRVDPVAGAPHRAAGHRRAARL